MCEASIPKEGQNMTHPRITELNAALEANHMYQGDGFAETAGLLSNQFEWNWDEVPVEKIQLGNPSDTYGCECRPSIEIMRFGRQAFRLAVDEFGEKFTIGMIRAEREEGEHLAGSVWYCTSARTLPASVVADAARLFERLGKDVDRFACFGGRVVRVGNPVVEE